MSNFRWWRKLRGGVWVDFGINGWHRAPNSVCAERWLMFTLPTVEDHRRKSKSSPKQN